MHVLYKAGPSSTAGTVLAVPLFESRSSKKPEKNGDIKIRYTLEHVRKWQASRLVLHPRVLLVCPIFRQRHTNQPTSNFQREALVKQSRVVYRSFQLTWFKQWPFLHYDESNDVDLHHRVQGKENEKSSC